MRFRCAKAQLWIPAFGEDDGGGDPIWGYRNFPAENAVAVGASRLIAFSLRESRNVHGGYAATLDSRATPENDGVGKDDGVGLRPRRETLSAMGTTPHRLETLSAMGTTPHRLELTGRG